MVVVVVVVVMEMMVIMVVVIMVIMVVEMMVIMVVVVTAMVVMVVMIVAMMIQTVILIIPPLTPTPLTSSINASPWISSHRPITSSRVGCFLNNASFNVFFVAILSNPGYKAFSSSWTSTLLACSEGS